MAIQVTSLNQLDPDAVLQLQEELTAMLRERHPEIEVASGPIRSIVLYLAGAFTGVNQLNWDRYRRSNTLKAIEADPTLADDEIVDGVVSNFLVDRQVGTRATGLATIVVSLNSPVVIGAETVFLSDGQAFMPGAIYIGRPVGTVIGSNDRELSALSDGTYAFTLPLTAVENGAAGNIRRGAPIVPVIAPENFVRAQAAADFTGGFDTELTAALTARLRGGMAAKTMGGQLNWEALIKQQAAFAQTLHYSIRGFGDPEQQRDQHTIWPGSLGGRVDIYAQTQQFPQTRRLTLEATLRDITAAGTVWQATLTADAAPGFYEVLQVLPPAAPVGDAGYAITQDVRGMDLTAADRVDIVEIHEAAYTRFQTAVIQFLDTDKPVGTLSVGDTAEYDFDVIAMPLIRELQEFCGGRNARPRACDVLIRAAVPCFVSVHFEVRTSAGEEAPDTAGMATAVASAVNQLGFLGQLHASLIADVAHNFLTGRQALGRIEMFGRIRLPNGTVRHIRATDVLTIPDYPGEQTTGETTIFLLDPQAVDITVVLGSFTET